MHARKRAAVIAPPPRHMRHCCMRVQVVWMISQVMDYVPAAVRARLVIKHLISDDLKHRPVLPLGARPAPPPPAPAAAPTGPRATKLSSLAPTAGPAGLPAAGATSSVIGAYPLLPAGPMTGMLYRPTTTSAMTYAPPRMAAPPSSAQSAASPADPTNDSGAVPPALDDVDALVIFATEAFTTPVGSRQHPPRSAASARHSEQKYLDIMECCTIPRMPAWLKLACVATACMHVQEWKPMPLKYVLSAVDSVSGSREHGIEWGQLLRRMLVRLAHGPLHAARVQVACRVLHRLSQREARAKAMRSVQ